MTTLHEMAEELKALERDAARYRWLRQHPDTAEKVFAWCNREASNMTTVDQAVDLAIKNSARNQG